MTVWSLIRQRLPSHSWSEGSLNPFRTKQKFKRERVTVVLLLQHVSGASFNYVSLLEFHVCWHTQQLCTSCSMSKKALEGGECVLSHPTPCWVGFPCWKHTGQNVGAIRILHAYTNLFCATSGVNCYIKISKGLHGYTPATRRPWI